MPAIGSAEFVIRAINKTQQTFTQIGAGVDNMDRRFKKLGGGLNRLGGLFATAFVGKQITDTITKFETLEASLRTVTGSADKASVAFGFIEKFAAETPFQLEEVVDAFIKLKSLGLTPSEEALTSYGNTATAMGKSLNQMIEAVADATTGEFERLKEFGIKSKTQGDQVTFTFQGVSTTVGKNAKEIEGYLQSIGNVQFAGAMKEQAGTLNVALSNMGDAFSKLVKAIGDAGLTDILIFIADKIKWLAQLITDSIEPFKLGFKAFIAEVIKFGNMFIAVFEGVGDAFNAFGDAISARFEALGQDLANFVNNPLAGVSFENTRAALETGLLDAMGTAFDKALARAQEFNTSIDAEIMAAADKIVEARQAKNQSLANLFQETKEPEKVAETAKEVKTFNKMQQEAQRIIDATRTPLENYNKEMSQLNLLLEKGYINQDTFGRAVEQANERLDKATQKTGETIEGEFSRIGETMEGTIVDSLDAIGGRFDSFGDFFKGMLSDINRSLLQSALKDLGVTGKGGMVEGLFSSIGGLFSGGGSSGGFGGMLSSVGSMFGGFFADGGRLSPGQFGIVGERGPELAFAGNSPMRIMPDAGMSAAPITITMNIQTPDVRSFRQSQSQIAADMARSIERARRNL
jgi:hypothetical protein